MNPPALSRADRARQILRDDLATFVARSFSAVNPGETYTPNWHIYALCRALEKVYAGETRRLLITMPPRYLKSICASVAFPAWALGKDPSLKIITASYGASLAAKHTRDFQTVVQAPFFARAFPEFGAPTRNTADEFVTRLNGGRRAVSLGGPVTGLGCGIIISDDFDEGLRRQFARRTAESAGLPNPDPLFASGRQSHWLHHRGAAAPA